MELEAGAIEGNLLDAGSLRTLGDELADRFRGRLVAAVRDFLAQAGLQRRSRSQYFSAARRDDLGVDVAVRAIDTQAHSLELGDFCPGFAGTAQTRFFPVKHMPPLLLFLRFLDNHHFVGVTNTLALVGFWLTIRTNFGGDLTDLLLVRALD